MLIINLETNQQEVLNLADIKRLIHSTENALTFAIDLEDGGQRIFKCKTGSQLVSWFSTLRKISQIFHPEGLSTKESLVYLKLN